MGSGKGKRKRRVFTGSVGVGCDWACVREEGTDRVGWLGKGGGVSHRKGCV